MIRTKCVLRWPLWICLLFIVQACTIGYSFTGADIPASAKTFSVKTFQLATPKAPPNYNIDITESLKDLLLSQTRLNFEPKRGDLQYEGTIITYETGIAAVTGNETTSLNRLTIAMKIKYTNTFEKDKNFERSFSAFTDYPSSQDFNNVEASLVETINRQLTQDIFDASLGAW